MGFLDHSGNSIIIDAVLTDKGRAFLARNDGSFSIVKFAFGDDEVDYTIIQKFGRTVGREKIEKNTPILEASTNGNIALKHRLISNSNADLTRLPSISLVGSGFSGNLLTMNHIGSNSKRSLTVSQDIQNENSIDVQLRDQAFIVKVPNLFLQISGESTDSVDSNNVATYVLIKTGETDIGGSELRFDLAVKSITNTQFQTYGDASDKNTISTIVSVSGIQSGKFLEFDVKITK